MADVVTRHATIVVNASFQGLPCLPWVLELADVADKHPSAFGPAAATLVLQTAVPLNARVAQLWSRMAAVLLDAHPALQDYPNHAQRVVDIVLNLAVHGYGDLSVLHALLHRLLHVGRLQLHDICSQHPTTDSHRRVTQQSHLHGE